MKLCEFKKLNLKGDKYLIYKISNSNNRRFYKRNKCIDGWDLFPDYCWCFSLVGAKKIVERLTEYDRYNHFKYGYEKINYMEQIKKKFTYGEIVSVGRRLRRYENLYNNFIQFAEQAESEFGDLFVDEFQTINVALIKMMNRYRVMYNNMLKTIR